MTTPDHEATLRMASDPARPVRGVDAQFAPGTIVARRFRIASILGAGGMGEVYRADDTKLGQTVALKFLPVRLERDPRLLVRLHDEVRLGRQIAHPNVCHLYDIVEWDGAHFVAMEYVDGEDLARLLRRIGRLTSDKAVDFARGIAAGLAAAHAKGILHRDLKPANIMIDSRGDARIMDFGLALAAGEDDGTISGTPAYMAPEQLDGAPATVQSDLYALGLVMYELFTGRRAHDARTMPERIRGINSEITTPSSHIRDLDPRIEKIILRCLSGDPAQRPASAREVIQALPGGDPLAAALAAGETPSPRVVAAAGTEGSLKPAAAWTLLAVTLAVIAVLFFISVRTGYWKRAGLPRRPDVQADRAAELLRRLGLPPQPFSSYGYHESDTHASWALLHDALGQDDIGRGYSVLRFWMREEAQPLFDSAFMHNPKPTLHLPPQVLPGSTAIEVDPRGRLLLLRAIPSPDLRPRALDWNELLRAAGLDPRGLTPAEPSFVPPSFADARAAWTGKYPEDATPVRIEAAAYRGVPVHFRILAPWDERDLRGTLPFGSGAFHAAGFALVVAAVLVGIVIAWRNLRARRGDRQGAWRIAAMLFAAGFVSQAAVAQHALSLLHEMNVFSYACMFALLVASAYWLVYIAIEPYVRRRWPEGLISWTRLLSGRWHDPMVGRDVLAGTAVGLLHALLATQTIKIRAFAQPSELPAVAGGDVRMFDSVLLPISGIASSVVSGAVIALSLAVVVMLVMTVVRRRRALPAIIFALYFALYLFASTEPIMLAIFAVLAAMNAFVLVRFGVLGSAASFVIFQVYMLVPLPDTLAWYTMRGLIPTIACAALALWAFRTSLGDQPLFRLDE
ncbi:MAG TPA: protein kinase [Thermoanaerobaculia bacterium]